MRYVCKVQLRPFRGRGREPLRCVPCKGFFRYFITFSLVYASRQLVSGQTNNIDRFSVLVCECQQLRLARVQRSLLTSHNCYKYGIIFVFKPRAHTLTHIHGTRELDSGIQKLNTIIKSFFISSCQS